MVEKKRVNIKLENSLHKKAKIIAVLKETNLNDYLCNAINSAVEKDMKLLKEVDL